MARPTEVITDSLGRSITVRDLNAVEQLRLLKACGPAQSMNQPYFHMAECAAMVLDIDGTPCPAPNNDRQIEGAVDKLGDEGMVAVMMFRTRKIEAMEAAARDAMEAGQTPATPLIASAS